MAASLARRIAVAAVFIPVFVLLALSGGVWFLVLVELIAALGAVEFTSLARGAGGRPHRAAAVAGCLALPVVMYFTGRKAPAAGGWAPGAAGLLITALVMIALAATLVPRAPGRRRLLGTGATAWGVLYLGWLPGHLVLLRETPRALGRSPAEGGRWVLFALLVTWALDTGAYAVGRLVGRHRLAPRVSPGKTIEGAVGGAAAAVGVALAARGWFQDWLGIADAIGVGLAASVAGIVGDLVESQLKRDAGVKDASGLIPGHGGILDRFDSLLFTAPVIYYLFVRMAAR